MDIATVTDVFDETNNIKTIKFKWPRKAEPGQFVMVWMPGVDEVPMSLSHAGKEGGITVLGVGEATLAMHDLRPDDVIGIRGPYGRGFDLRGRKVLAIGGGSGAAALALAVEKAVAGKKQVTCALGARTAGELLFRARFAGLGAQVHVATDDGSEGHHGFVTELAAKLISRNEPDLIIACGPEPMLKAVADMSLKAGIRCQCSLERYMKCGIGLCGSCQCGKFTVCRDGPVFTGEELALMDDFGKRKRDPVGRNVGLGR